MRLKFHPGEIVKVKVKTKISWRQTKLLWVLGKVISSQEISYPMNADTRSTRRGQVKKVTQYQVYLFESKDHVIREASSLRLMTLEKISEKDFTEFSTRGMLEVIAAFKERSL